MPNGHAFERLGHESGGADVDDKPRTKRFVRVIRPDEALQIDGYILQAALDSPIPPIPDRIPRQGPPTPVI